METNIIHHFILVENKHMQEIGVIENNFGEFIYVFIELWTLSEEGRVPLWKGTNLLQITRMKNVLYLCK